MSSHLKVDCRLHRWRSRADERHEEGKDDKTDHEVGGKEKTIVAVCDPFVGRYLRIIYGQADVRRGW